MILFFSWEEGCEIIKQKQMKDENDLVASNLAGLYEFVSTAILRKMAVIVKIPFTYELTIIRILLTEKIVIWFPS